MLLPCWSQLSYSTEAQLQFRHCARVELNCRCSIKSALNGTKNIHSRKHISKIYEFNLTWYKHNIGIAAMPELCSIADLVVFNCSAESNFDSDVLLLPCFCQTEFFNYVWQGRSTTYELGLILPFAEHFTFVRHIYRAVIMSQRPRIFPGYYECGPQLVV